MEQGVMPAYMAVGATAGLKRYLAEQNLPQTIEGASRILAEDSCLNAGDPITALILKNYRLLLDGCTLPSLLWIVDAQKCNSLRDVILTRRKCRMNKLQIAISETGVVPVIKLNHPQRDAVPLAKALCAGGVPVAEVTFRAAGAADAIRLMKEAAPDMSVGAGTVLTTAQIDEALAAGAQFIVTPGMDPDLVRYCQEKGVDIFPGCTTPTDYHTAYTASISTCSGSVSSAPQYRTCNSPDCSEDSSRGTSSGTASTICVRSFFCQ